MSVFYKFFAIQFFFLFKNIEVYTDNKEKLISDEAIIDLQKDIITLLSNVKYENQNNRIESDKSVIFDQAENRMHAQKAAMLWLLGIEI